MYTKINNDGIVSICSVSHSFFWDLHHVDTGWSHQPNWGGLKLDSMLVACSGSGTHTMTRSTETFGWWFFSPKKDVISCYQRWSFSKHLLCVWMIFKGCFRNTEITDSASIASLSAAWYLVPFFNSKTWDAEYVIHVICLVSLHVDTNPGSGSGHNFLFW